MMTAIKTDGFLQNWTWPSGTGITAEADQPIIMHSFIYVKCATITLSLKTATKTFYKIEFHLYSISSKIDF